MKIILALLVGSFLTVQGAIACSTHNGIEFCKGDHIMMDNNDTGKILEVFSNGKAAIETSDPYYYKRVKHLSTLAKKVRCFKNFCKGSRVILDGGSTGNIISPYSNGKATVLTDDPYFYTYVKHISTLGLGYRCSGSLCVGDRVMAPANWTGEVQEIFDNGTVVVERDDPYFYIKNLNIHTLGYELDCYN